jgi:hypothetical protein
MLNVEHQVERFIEALPEPEQAIAARLRRMLIDLVPGIEEKFRYKLPFYDYYGMFCYLHFDKGGLHLGFCRGKDLLMAFPQLELKNRSTIASVTLRSLADIQRHELLLLIPAAADWNREAAAQKILLVNRKNKEASAPVPFAVANDLGKNGTHRGHNKTKGQRR